MSDLKNAKGETFTPYDVAKRYYDMSFDRSYKVLAHTLGFPEKFDENKLSRMVREWERRGLIKHQVFPANLSYLPRRSDLEDKLRQRFGLRSAIVADTSIP